MRDNETCSQCGKHADRYVVDTEDPSPFATDYPLCVDCVPTGARDQIAEIFDRVLKNPTEWTRELILRGHFMDFVKSMGGEAKLESGDVLRGVDKWGWTLTLRRVEPELPWAKGGLEFLLHMLPPKATTPK